MIPTCWCQQSVVCQNCRSFLRLSFWSFYVISECGGRLCLVLGHVRVPESNVVTDGFGLQPLPCWLTWESRIMVVHLHDPLFQRLPSETESAQVRWRDNVRSVAVENGSTTWKRTTPLQPFQPPEPFLFPCEPLLSSAHIDMLPISSLFASVFLSFLAMDGYLATFFSGDASIVYLIAACFFSFLICFSGTFPVVMAASSDHRSCLRCHVPFSIKLRRKWVLSKFFKRTYINT